MKKLLFLTTLFFVFSIPFMDAQVLRENVSEELYILTEEDIVPKGLLRDYYKTNNLDLSKSFTNDVLVANPFVEPFSFNVLVEIETQDGLTFQCSGALIDAKWVLLSGNCISSKDFAGFKGLIKRAVVYPAYDTDQNIPFGYAESADVIVQDEWAFDRDLNFNVGYFPLDRPIGAAVKYWTAPQNSDPTQFFDVVTETDATYANETFSSQSYPLGNGVEEGKMYTRSGTFDIEDIQEHVVYTDKSSKLGQLGSVLYRLDNGIPKASAVLSHNRNEQSGYVRLNDDVSSTINRLLEEGYNIVNPDGESGSFIESRPSGYDLIPLPGPNLPGMINTQQNQGELLDTLYAGVTNYSKDGFNSNFTLEIFISKDDQYDTDDIILRSFTYRQRIDPDETFFFDLANSVRIPGNLADGKYYIGVKLDVFEINRKNSANNTPLKGDLLPIIIGTGIEPESPCESAPKLTCGVTYTFDTSGESDTYNNRNGLYDGCIEGVLPESFTYEARDIVLSFEVAEQADVTIEMTNLRTFLDLFVFAECSPGVQDNAVLSSCVGAANRGGRGDEILVLPDLAAGTYYIVVDAIRSSNMGRFDIKVSCPIVVPDPCTLVDSVLTCGNTYLGNTSGGVSSFDTNDYQGDCAEGIDASDTYDAPDQLFAFTVPEGKTWDIQLASVTAGADLDMFLFEKSACDDGVFSPCFDRAEQLLVDTIIVNTTTTTALDTTITTSFDTTTTTILDTITATIMDTVTTTTLDTITTTTTDTVITTVNGVTVMIINVVTNNTVNVVTNNFITPVTITTVDTTTTFVVDTIISITIDTLIRESFVTDTLNYTVDSIRIFKKIPAGQYYLVIDGASSNSVGAFALDVTCSNTIIEGPEPEIPNICDLGGEFVSGDRIRIQNLSLNPAEDVTFADVTVPDCVLGRYGADALKDIYFDTYILYLTPEEAQQGIQLEFEESLAAFVFSCGLDGAGEETANCLAVSNASSGGLNFTPSATDPDGTFYYIVLAGAADVGYDLNIQVGEQIGPCQEVSEIIENIGVVEIGNLIGEVNNFDINSETVAGDIYSCYVGSNSFEGPDVVYQLDIKEATTLDIILDTETNPLPLFEGATFGLFLYDYRCGSESVGCIRYDETTEDDKVLEINIELVPGFYYLVLDSDLSGTNMMPTDEASQKEYDDLVKNGSANGYELDVSETNDLSRYRYTAPSCADSLDISDLRGEELNQVTYQVNTSRTFNDIRLGRHRLTSEDIMAYYYLDGERPKLAAANSYDDEGFSIRVRGLDEADPLQEKCSFVNGDAIVLKIDDGHSAVYDVEAILGTKIDGTDSDGAFSLGGQMVLDSLKELKTKRFKVVPNVVNLTNLSRARCNCTYMNILADAEDTWELEGPEGVDFSPKTGQGSKRVRIQVSNPSGLADGSEDRVIKITRLASTEGESPDVLNSRKVQIVYLKSEGSENVVETEEREEEIVSEDKIKIMPNPASDQFTIRAIGEKQINQLQIFDGFGKVIYHQANWKNNQYVDVDTANLPSGIYFVRVTLGDQIFTQKVVVQK